MNINFCTFDLGELRKASNSETFDVINDVADGKITDAYEIAKELHDHHIPYKLLFFAEHGLLRNEIEEVYEEKFLPLYKKCLKEGIAEFIGAESKE